MLQTLKKQIIEYKILAVLCCIVFGVLICFGPYLPSDSVGYLDASYTRGLFYPLFLNLCRNFSASLNFVVFIQLLLGLGSIFYTVLCFSKLSGRRLGLFLQFSLGVVLMSPYLGHTNIGNTILTEPIAYPMFLVFFCELLLWQKFKEVKHFYIGLVLALCMMLTRKQLGFVFASFYGWIFLDFLHTKKIKIFTVLLPMVFFASGLYIEKSYVYMKTGIFMSTPSAIFTISAPLYIAKESDVALLKTPEQKYFLEEALKERDRQKLGMQQEQYPNFSWPYHKKFEIIHDVLSYQISSKILGHLKLDVPQTEELIGEVRTTILKNNLVSFYKFYYHNIISNIGGYHYFFAILCAFCVCLWQVIKRDSNYMAYLGLQATSLQFLNYGIVAIFMPVLRRYSLYTDGLMICFWLLSLSIVFDNKKND